MANTRQDSPSPDAIGRSLASDSPFEHRLATIAERMEALLDRLLNADPMPDEQERPGRLIEAMRYGCLGGGKRFRPFLVVECAGLFGVPERQALMAGAALECIHCYSLVHDDLPAMDNDDLRRGRPTAHKAFDEATAILAGDGLLTLAFDIMSRPEVHPSSAVRIELVSSLARASGIGGMAGGQMLDLMAEGRFDNQAGQLDLSRIQRLQRMKTGALLRFACVAGALLGEAKEPERRSLEQFGEALGEAFQIADDLLDFEGDAAIVGKATGKDAAAHKATFVSALGAERARQRLSALILEAERALAPFGSAASMLRQAAHFVATRQS